VSFITAGSASIGSKTGFLYLPSGIVSTGPGLNTDCCFFVLEHANRADNKQANKKYFDNLFEFTDYLIKSAGHGEIV
jgi:hypothetical protein